MTPQQFSQLLNQHAAELDALFRRRLPIVVGRMAKDHFQDNFRKQGFVNNGLHKWKPTQHLSSNTRYTPLLSARNHLFSSIFYTPSDYRVVVDNSAPYAPIHNWGGEISPTVTPRMRRFAWAMYYKTRGKQTTAVGDLQSPTTNTQLSPTAQFWKSLALTPKKKLHIRIPQRQFIGESAELQDKIQQRIETEITNIIS